MKQYGGQDQGGDGVQRGLDEEGKKRAMVRIEQLANGILLFSVKRNGPFLNTNRGEDKAEPEETGEMLVPNQASNKLLKSSIETANEIKDTKDDLDLVGLDNLEEEIKRAKKESRPFMPDGARPAYRGQRTISFRYFPAELKIDLPDDLLKVKDLQKRALFASEQALFNLVSQQDKTTTEIIFQLRHRVSFFGVFSAFERIKNLSKRLQRLENLEDENTMLKFRIEHLMKDNITRTMQAKLE